MKIAQRIKRLFASAFIAVIILFSAALQQQKISAAPQEISTVKLDYTYVRQYIDGRLWMFVYDEDGNLVNAYPLDE